MPPPELSNRFQKAVLWEFVTFDQYGDPVVTTATEIFVRWEEVRKQKIDRKSVV